jgi:hypothetical protein
MLQVLIDGMKELSKELNEQKWACSDAYRTMLLGNFIWESQKLDISGRNFNEIEHPFHGVSFEALKQGLSECTDPPIWYRRASPTSEMFQVDICSLENFLKSAVNASKAHMRKRLEELAK